MGLWEAFKRQNECLTRAGRLSRVPTDSVSSAGLVLGWSLAHCVR